VIRFQRLALAATIATYILVVIGGTVRATGSGLACPDWPTCHGRLLPPLEQHNLIEYSHRLFASIVSVLVLVALVAAWKYFRRDRAITSLATLATAILVIQVILGAVTVQADLPASVVTAHLGTAMLLLGCLTVLTLVSFRRTSRQDSSVEDPAGARSFRNAAIVAALGLYVLLLSGTYVAGSGAGAACSGWPLCNGQVFPHGAGPVQIHFMHRFLVAVITVALALLVYGAYRWQRHNRRLVHAVRGAFALFVIQAFIGALNVWTSLATGVRILHLAVAAALWVALVTIAWMGYAAARPVATPAFDDAQRQGVARRSQEVAG
jgi:heme A synthase